MSNPYASPPVHEFRDEPTALPPSSDSAVAARRLFPVAVSLMAVSIVAISGAVLALVFFMMVPPPPHIPEDQKKFYEYYRYAMLVYAAMPLPIMYGAVAMMRRSSYFFAWVAAVLACIPFFSPCYVLAIPFGIWGIIVLCDPQVRRGFKTDKF